MDMHASYKQASASLHQRLKVKDGDIALNGMPISELQSVTCRMGSHSFTCHLTQVNAPCLNPCLLYTSDAADE